MTSPILVVVARGDDAQVLRPVHPGDDDEVVRVAHPVSGRDVVVAVGRNAKRDYFFFRVLPSTAECEKRHARVLIFFFNTCL